MKVIPAIDLMDGQVVRLLKGDPEKKTTYSDKPVEVAKRWQDAGADMIHLVDLDATLGRGTNMQIIRDITRSLDIPVEVAGGLRSEKVIYNIAQTASRVVVGTLAFKDKDALEKIIGRLESKIVVSVDHLDGHVAISGWQEKTDVKLLDAVNDFTQMGITEFLITDVNRDGTMQGPELEYLKQVCARNDINVIASGGISNIDDVKKVREINPFGVILGKALYEDKITIKEAKNT